VLPQTQQPAPRLRHLQSITLRGFDPGCQLDRQAGLFFELWRLAGDGSRRQLVYVSEQVYTVVGVSWVLLAGVCMCVRPAPHHLTSTSPPPINHHAAAGAV
jgi:hypothetical protein